MHKISLKLHNVKYTAKMLRKMYREKLMTESRNLWGGRFTGSADKDFIEFNRSYGFDRRLLDADVRASVAHCNA